METRYVWLSLGPVATLISTHVVSILKAHGAIEEDVAAGGTVGVIHAGPGITGAVWQRLAKRLKNIRS